MSPLKKLKKHPNQSQLLKKNDGIQNLKDIDHTNKREVLKACSWAKKLKNGKVIFYKILPITIHRLNVFQAN